MRRRPFLIASALAVFSCSPSDDAPAEPPCVAIDPSCRPQYDPPTFATIHAKILQPTCATGIGTCHTADAQKGGMVFEQIDPSYAALLGKDGSHARVLPGDPSCSLLMKRLASTDPNYRMPRGPTPLTAGEQCTIAKWIAAGAAR